MRTISGHPGFSRFVWTVCGAFVLSYILLAALGAFEPGDVVAISAVAVVLAALLLAHEWREQFRDER